MASSSHHRLPNLLFFISIFFTSINGSFAQPPSNICPPFDCGNGVVIRYPLWHQSQQLEHCGYQGLNISCRGQNPVINLDSHLYKIKSINYSDNSLVVSYADQIQDLSCPEISSNLNTKLTSSVLFDYNSGNKILTFFYNCTLYPPSQRDITCFQTGAKRSFVFAAIPEFDWHANCESTVTVPVIDSGGAVNDGELLVGSFGQALKEGFKLTWRTPAGTCQACEAAYSYGFCGYSNGTDGGQNFFCICPEGRRSIVCYVERGVTFVPNYFMIGALIFGGLMTVATVSYFISKKRVPLYKPVSHK